MVREELQRESELNKDEQTESPFTQAASAEEVQQEEKGPGLLSKMLRQPGILAVRAVSLHNLLDQPPASSQLQPPALASFPASAGLTAFELTAWFCQSEPYFE